MNGCDSCKQDCMKNTQGISVYSCMQEKCPNCISDSSICKNQQIFDKAVEKAIKYNVKENRLSNWSLMILSLIIIGIIFWALCLANNISHRKTIHYILALLFSPFYIVSYYINIPSE